MQSTESIIIVPLSRSTTIRTIKGGIWNLQQKTRMEKQTMMMVVRHAMVGRVLLA